MSHEAGKTLLRFDQYALAREFLERAAGGMPAARPDLAMALLFTDGPKRALEVLEQVPEGQDTGDGLLLKAWILDAAGQGTEAEKVLDQSLRYAGSRPRLAREAALLLVRHGQSGPQEPAARCAMARLSAPAAPDPQCSCQPGIYEPFFPSCQKDRR